ncbi:MAG: DNA-binding protein [bacterium]|nr:DNA-binding protein [bacterium]
MATEKKLTAIREPYTKAKLIAAISEDTGLTRKEVASVFESLGDYMHRHLKKRSAGTFTLPGLAKFSVSSKKATKARKGINPFTGEETTFAAKPARRVVKIRALKGVKEMAES